MYEYTVPGSGLWYHLYFQVRLYQVAGGGDYTINLRLNDGDILADDAMVPKTTYTAAAGLQNIWFQGEALGGSGDVFNVMCLGLAGDTAVVGSIRIFADDAVGATTYGATLDVSATGEAGLDFSNIKAAANPTTLTNITVPVVTTLTNAPTDMATATNQTTIINRIGAFTGTGINTVLGFLRALGAKAALLTPTDLSTGTTYDNTTDSQEAIRDNMGAAAPTALAVADAVWDEILATHTGLGSTGEALTTAASASGATPATFGHTARARSHNRRRKLPRLSTARTS